MPKPRQTLPYRAREIAFDACGDGLYDETRLAAALGMPLRAWRKLAREDDAGRELHEELMAAERDHLLRQLHAWAQGTDKPATSAAVASVIFRLKARHGYRDIGSTESRDTAPRVNVVLNLPRKMTSEEFFGGLGLPVPAKLIEHKGNGDDRDR